MLWIPKDVEFICDDVDLPLGGEVFQALHQTSVTFATGKQVEHLKLLSLLSLRGSRP